MDLKERIFYLLSFIISLVVGFFFPLSVDSQCNGSLVIVNFGDSNSDTGGYVIVRGMIGQLPKKHTISHDLAGRMCDGRLVIDFLCESVKNGYLTPFMESMGKNFTNGVNFAIAGSKTLPASDSFNLKIQIAQFHRFRSLSLELFDKGNGNLLGDEDLRNALYTIDIGQNDLDGVFGALSYEKAILKIPDFIFEIETAIKEIYEEGGKNFWVHNTGPIGCLPKSLATYNKYKDDYDEHGCLISLNEGAKIFNDKLYLLCEKLRDEMKNITIVYLDVYSIKYDLIANSSNYGFVNPLMACCGYGGPPYNYESNNKCGQGNYTICEDRSKYISWDGAHYTEEANAAVASKILSTNYSTPPLKFDSFCNIEP
ncbi:GDSL esterase/lipase At1g09390-like [Nicotiana tabacum]|uniref:GDSL esterase/lipase At1g09390-like n=2 Tax=Nicotiana TaxID=4085 RepID=A0A1S4C7Q5_TOBAC|nr:GDSL esterase/lipase At1g09390-like [Nicotiana tomentosiformis]XP_016496974.1 PREDICTED: GDSL esterase/lipase At1g09390-like [Nicotiana tabacum]